MNEYQVLTANMVPALDLTSQSSSVGDINRVPALRVVLTVGEERLQTVGVIDTGSEYSIIDDALLRTLSTKPTSGTRVSLSTGLSRKQLWMYHLDVALIGDIENQQFNLPSVPVVVANLDRNFFIIGRRGILDKLKVELDFPRNTIRLMVERLGSQDYPSLAEKFPNFEPAIQCFATHELAQATMLLAWDMETFVDRVFQENFPTTVADKSSSTHRMTLGEKLRYIATHTRMPGLITDIQRFVDARNTAFHASSDKMNELSADLVLAAAERVVSELSRMASEEKLGMTYQVFRDAHGEWRWRLRAANGRVIAHSSQGYRRKQDCLDDINKVKKNSETSVVEV
jgi:uncharacterized protein YegP (UPF0339 family)